MGDIADMMIEGDLCGTCGEAFEDSGDGFPRYCSSACNPDPKPDKKDRFLIAVQRIRKAGFEPKVCSEQNFHIQVGEWNFWAWTGKIHHPKIRLPEGQDRGIANFIKALKSNS